MKKVAIIDYGMGNLDSVARSVSVAGGNAVVTGNRQEIKSSDCIILPGVGAFGVGIKSLKRMGIIETLWEQVLVSCVPLLGICLGMHLLSGVGTEGGTFEGLGFVEGTVKRMSSNGECFRIPHMGWNEVQQIRSSPLFEGIVSGKDFYFCHSYQFLLSHKSLAIAVTPYGHAFVSAVQKDNIYGVQFHPEKSQRVGAQLIKNFIRL